MVKISQKELIFSYYLKHPNEDIPHESVVDWASEEYLRITGHKLRDPDRQIRSLHQIGKLIKVKKGVYKYDPSLSHLNESNDFTEAQKKAILERGGYVCAICGRGSNEGFDLHVDHIKPKELGGTSDIDNGQVLCSKHNMYKKHYKQTETGKRMFLNLHKLAVKSNDEELKAFIEDILNVYDKHNINGHIKWDQ